MLVLGGAVYTDERTDNDRVRTVTLLSVLATLALAVLVLAVEANSPGGTSLVVTRVSVVGVAVHSYDGTESLVTPILVYTTFAVVSTVLGPRLPLLFLEPDGLLD